MNMILHGIDAPNIIDTNTLTENLSDIQDKNRFDVILANPPFGGKERKEVQQKFPIKTGETAFLFLQHFIKILRVGGRAAFVIKNTFLSNSDNASRALRQELLSSCNLHTILDCPSGTFIGAGVKTVVLFLRRESPLIRCRVRRCLLRGRKDDLNSVLNAPSLAAYAQRVRRNRERYKDEPILLKRLDILKEKRFLFTNHLKYEDAPTYCAPLDRAMRFLDEKLLNFGQFRAADAINPMLNAWAIVNNLRQFLPDAAKAGQSLAEHFGVNLREVSWMEALNLCTVGRLDAMTMTTS
jgi:hypothetical protein